MKQLSKQILAICILLLSFSFNANAAREGFNDSYPESKFVDRFASPSKTTAGDDTGGLGDGPGEEDRLGAPVGDISLMLVLGLGFVYGVSIFSKKKKFSLD
jgi:hypothetical protein